MQLGLPKDVTAAAVIKQHGTPGRNSLTFNQFSLAVRKIAGDMAKKKAKEVDGSKPSKRRSFDRVSGRRLSQDTDIDAPGRRKSVELEARRKSVELEALTTD